MTSLDASLADSTALRIDERQQAIDNPICRFGEEHRKAPGERLPKSSASQNHLGGRHYVIQFLELLFVVLAEKPALLQVLTTYAVTRPGYRIESLIRQCLATVRALGILAIFDPLERFIDQV